MCVTRRHRSVDEWVYARSTAPSVRVSRPHRHFPFSQPIKPISPNHRHHLIRTCIPRSLHIPKMMLTASVFQPSMPHYSPYTPPRSSPLSERSANANARLFDFNMPSPSKKKPHRAFKSNPVMVTRDAAAQRRRDMFFKRVQNNRNDKQWESRGEQVCPALLLG